MENPKLSPLPPLPARPSRVRKTVNPRTGPTAPGKVTQPLSLERELKSDNCWPVVTAGQPDIPSGPPSHLPSLQGAAVNARHAGHWAGFKDGGRCRWACVPTMVSVDKALPRGLWETKGQDA